MAICKYVGGGIGGAIGKWGAGLGSALGLGTAVDIGVRAYTGYGLLETLSVPYIECPDGSYASAIEWYGSGLKCSKKAEPIIGQLPPPGQTQKNATLGYDELLRSLGGLTYTYWGNHFFGIWTGSRSTTTGKIRPGHWKSKNEKTDTYGNVLATGVIQEGTGDSSVRGSILDGQYLVDNFGYGGWRSMTYPNGLSTIAALIINPFLFTQNNAVIGTRAFVPDSLSIAPPAASIPPPPAFSPNPPSPPEECDMSCPCLTKADIEMAVKKALGLKTFSPEKLIREIGAKMFVAPGPSVVPVIPKNLVEAIAALVATTYMRAGYGRYPVLMPNSLINDDGIADAAPTLPIENYAEWFEWFIKQQDAIQGEWPIDIAIVDGAKRQPLRFENISEALAEITGLVIQTATDADAAVSVASHAAVAATKATTAAVIAQKNAECIIKFFGIRTGFGSIFVDSVITPMDSDSPNFNLKKFLTPSKQSVAFYTDDDPFDFQATLDRILRNSEIAKAAVAMDASKEIVGDYARNQRKYDTAEAKREAEKELEKLETSLKAQNPGMQLKIKVDTPAAGEIQGNNFVIKRPKT